MNDLKEDFFKDQKIKCMGYSDQLPEGLDPIKHMEILAKLWAKLRHELHNTCQHKLKEL